MSSIAKPIPFDDILSAWSRLTKNLPLSRITSKRQYALVVRAMEYLADFVADDPKHPFTGLLDVLEVLVEDFDRSHHTIPSISGLEFLRQLLVEHHLKQSDLSEIGSQGVISEILAGKRRLNKRHAALLSKRFLLPEELFMRPDAS